MAKTVFTGRFKRSPKGWIPTHFVSLCLCDVVTNKTACKTLTLMVDPGSEIDLDDYETHVHQQVSEMFARLSRKCGVRRAAREPVALLTQGKEADRG